MGLSSKRLVTPPFQGGDPGSNPGSPTKNIVRRQPCYCDNEVEHLRLILQSIQIITNRKRFNDSLAPDEQVAFCEK